MDDELQMLIKIFILNFTGFFKEFTVFGEQWVSLYWSGLYIPNSVLREIFSNGKKISDIIV